MDDVRDPVVVERLLHRGELGDVAAHEGNALELVVGGDLADPARIGRQVERDHGRALLDQVPDGPGADAAQGSRHQEPFTGVPASLHTCFALHRLKPPWSDGSGTC